MDPLVSATHLPKKMVNGLLKWRIQRLLNKPVEPCPNCYEPGSVATRGHLNECMGWKNLLGPFVTQQELEPRWTWLDVVLNQINWDSDSELAEVVKNILRELHIKVLGKDYSL
jgi:hypothetical protein